LDGSCETPIAGLAVLDGNTLTLRGEILRPDGSQSLSGSREGTLSEGAELGRDLALDLKSQAGPDFFDWRIG
jgi:hydroxymethylbilane synthase